MLITKAAAADKKLAFILLIPLRSALHPQYEDFPTLSSDTYAGKHASKRRCTCNPDIFHLKRGEQSGIPGYGKSRA